MKEGSLFCFVGMRSTELGCAADRVLGDFGKLSTRRGAWAFGSTVFRLAVQKFLIIE
jgi:hypothetical protein